MNSTNFSHVTADPTSNAVLNWVSDSSWRTVPKAPFSLYYPFQVIDIHTGPQRPCRGGILCTLDESSTLMSLSDFGLTAILCLGCLVLTSMPKQYTKHNVKSPSGSSQTDAQTNLSFSGAAACNQRAIIRGMFRASVVSI